MTRRRKRKRRRKEEEVELKQRGVMIFETVIADEIFTKIS